MRDSCLFITERFGSTRLVSTLAKSLLFLGLLNVCLALADWVMM